MTRGLFVACAMASFLLAAPSSFASAAEPTTWDNLDKVESKRLDLAYVLRGADFRPYTKVMLDPTEIAFRKNWQRDYNTSSMRLGGRLTDKDVQEMIAEGRELASGIFAKELAAGGYQVVTTPGPDVLRMRTAVIDVAVTAPDTMSAPRSRTYTRDAGEATLIIELRDSMTGAILGRAVDRRLAGDNTIGQRTSVSNRADFSRLLRDWARTSVKGLDALKEASSGGGVDTTRK